SRKTPWCGVRYWFILFPCWGFLPGLCWRRAMVRLSPGLFSRQSPAWVPGLPLPAGSRVARRVIRHSCRGCWAGRSTRRALSARYAERRDTHTTTVRPWLLMVVGLWLLVWQSAATAQLPDFTDLVEEASPAVVNISTRQNVPARGAGVGPMIPELEGLPPIFREFFERSIPDGSRSAPQR